MASITDCISEGLRYPFNDLKKILSFGLLFAIINMIAFGILEKSIDVFRLFSAANGNTLAFKFSQIPSIDIYIIAGLAIISFIISLIIMGYLYNVIKFSIDEKDELPGFEDILGLLVNGVKYFIASLVYNLIPMIVLLAGGIGLHSVQNGDYIVMTVAGILFIICNFLLIMALANMADNDKFTKAFDLREITDKISNLGWGRYIGIVLFTIIIYAIIMTAVGIILLFLSMFVALALNQTMVIIALISIIEGLLISSYISVFFNRVYGSIYRESVK
jgi:hypothetical protein